jgi:hypothetical protein
MGVRFGLLSSWTLSVVKYFLTQSFGNWIREGGTYSGLRLALSNGSKRISAPCPTPECRNIQFRKICV